MPGSRKLLELESLSIQEEPPSSIVKDFSQVMVRVEVYVGDSEAHTPLTIFM